jgi:hypothetical protein
MRDIRDGKVVISIIHAGHKLNFGWLFFFYPADLSDASFIEVTHPGIRNRSTACSFSSYAITKVRANT